MLCRTKANQAKALDLILGLKIRTLYPELAKELSPKKRLTNVALISDIIKTHYSLDYSNSPRGRLTFLSAIINLYDPDVLDGWKGSLCHGIRKQLSELFEVTPSAISNNIVTAKNYMLIYKKFNENVVRLSDEIAAVYCQKQNKS